MNGTLRVTAMVNRVKPLNPKLCLESIISLLEQEKERQPDLIVLPQLALCSPSCGNLFHNRALLEQCQDELTHLAAACEGSSAYLVVGLAAGTGGQAVSACAVLYGGRLLGLIPALEQPEGFAQGPLPEPFLPTDTVFALGEATFSVLACAPQRLPLYSEKIRELGCDIVVVPSYEPVMAGSSFVAQNSLETVSRTLGRAVIAVNGGIGDTSSPYLYQGYAGIYECGSELAFERAAYSELALTCDLDLDVIRSQKTVGGFKAPVFRAAVATSRPNLLRRVEQNPYLPSGPEKQRAFLEELFDLQVRSLVARMESTGIKKAVVGVSGGLDSTLALLVAASALDVLEYPRQNLIAVTMPGFGTSDRTYYNALSLIQALGAQGKDISIKAAALQHFEDIGQDPSLRDVTYENAQARERAQILLDLANRESALVVGTGDLSEEALGWCTFSGDHISNYNVNVCLTKTMIRLVVALLAKGVHSAVAETLQDILDTPVSPELLPPDENGEIHQKTEEILGPYPLHEFFLYYFTQYQMPPRKVYEYACKAFEDELEPAFIKEKLRLFIRRFFSGQFKRSCSPDSAQITAAALTPSAFYIPSDASPAALLKELEGI